MREDEGLNLGSPKGMRAVDGTESEFVNYAETEDRMVWKVQETER